MLEADKIIPPDFCNESIPYVDADDISVSESGDSVASDTTRDEYQEVRKLVNSDEKKIGFWRLVVIITVVAVGVGVTWMTYSFLLKEEKKSFETTFEQNAVTIIESSAFTARAIRESYDAFGDHATSYAVAQNATGPFFTIPDLTRHGANLRRQTKSLGFLIMRIIETAEKEAWERYAMLNQYWDGFLIPFIFRFDEAYQPTPVTRKGPFGPVWEVDPLPLAPLFNYDNFMYESDGEDDTIQGSLDFMKALNRSFYGPTVDTMTMLTIFPDEMNTTRDPREPLSTYLVPIYDKFDRSSARMVGLLNGFVQWGLFFSDLLSTDVGDVMVVVDNGNCGRQFTWRIDGRVAVFLDESDLHETKYDNYKISTLFGSTSRNGTGGDSCLYQVHVYPSSNFEANYTTNKPVIIAAVVGCIFAFVVMAFFAFDYFQTQRNDKILSTAAKASAVMNAVFPAQFRDRLLVDGSQENENSDSNVQQSKTKTYFASHNQRIKKFLDGSDDAMLQTKSKPIAEFYPEITVMFADIVGFTAWCSVREPSQVFTLLEMLYASFDDIAKKRRVFKVETVGDCYVAACGLPDKRKDHALVMARFAQACLQKTNSLMKRLEVQLGPDTGDLTIRIGLHSGPVTAGVLRGERARFQLFGDTMNIAARMESTGLPGRIHLSEEAAQCLNSSQKQHWVHPRSEQVNIKGKGNLQTYWLNTKTSGVNNRGGREGSTCGSELSSSGDGNENGQDHLDSFETGKRDRLVDWHVDVFSGLLKQIVARRHAVELARGKRIASTDDLRPRFNSEYMVGGRTCLDEVKAIIELPKFDSAVAKYEKATESINLDPSVVAQLRDYICTISHMYRRNAFHNFEHASHVTMSVSKLLSRIVMPSDLWYEGDELNEKTVRRQIASTLHDHTYGITSDPLTQFAVVFSALVHDVDHAGVPNVQLIQENPKLAAVYKDKSVAEQNSIVLAWDLLMHASYADLRAVLYTTPEEQSRFRQLVVQTVLATDIADKELKVLRNARWDSAFLVAPRGDGQEAPISEDPQVAVNRKATIVIEHLIQASDVAHTMQHWHVYRKWNENFFVECYQAYLDGRADMDPSINWYKGEIGFFDFYIIPLAKKLKDCGVFGVASDEYLTYAVRNRREWEERGQEVVAEMIRSFQLKYGEATGSTNRISTKLMEL